MTHLFDCRQIQTVYGPAVMAHEGRIELLKMGIIMTHVCTLRCRSCAERTPYYHKRYSPTFEFLIKQCQAYFRLVDYTMKLDISGGEPLTRTDLPEFFGFLLEHRRQFGRARIVTNGTIAFSDRLVCALKRFGPQVDVLIDCYSDRGKLLSVNAEKNAEKLESAGISFIFRKQSEKDLYCGGWVEFGDLTQERSEEQFKKNLANCAILKKIGGGARMKNGVITPCAITQQLDDFGVLPLQEGEYVDLFDEGKTLEEKREALLRMFSFSELSSCRYCDGMREDSERFPPAQQL